MFPQSIAFLAVPMGAASASLSRKVMSIFVAQNGPAHPSPFNFLTTGLDTSTSSIRAVQPTGTFRRHQRRGPRITADSNRHRNVHQAWCLTRWCSVAICRYSYWTVPAPSSSQSTEIGRRTDQDVWILWTKRLQERNRVGHVLDIDSYGRKRIFLA